MTSDKLRACWWQHKRIASIKARIKRIEEQITSAAAKPLNHAPAGGADNHDAIGEAVARMEDLRRDLTQEVIRLEDQIREVETWIDALPPHKAGIMRLRYVDGLGWRQTARISGYSESHCRNINSEIMDTLE